MRLSARLLFTALLLASFAGAALAHALFLESKNDEHGSLARSANGKSGEAARALDPRKARSADRSATALSAERVALRPGDASRALATTAPHDSSKLDARAALAGGSRSEDAATKPTGRAATAEQKEKIAAALAQVDWSQTLKDMVAAMKARRAGGKLDMDACVESARVNLALTEAAQALGLPYPQAALSDPTVRATIVPAWLGALGVNLDPAQAAQISSSCLALPPSADPSLSFLAAKQAALQSRIALEQSLANVLTADQMETYAKNIVNDPLMKASGAQLAVSARSQAGLVQIVANYWSSSFQLDPGSRNTAQAVASQYVAAALAVPPVAPNLDPEATRLAVMDRTSQLVQLQSQAEQALAASSTLSQGERTRAQAGSTKYLRLAIPR
jgi:hypothetical protein